MPWNTEDALKHTKKADTEKKQKQWSEVANSVFDRCMSGGGDQKTCEMKSITQANGVIAKLEENKNLDKFYYLTDLSNIELEEKEGKKSSWIEIFREGKWQHPKYGEIIGDKNIFNDFITNWKNNVLGRELSIDKTHEPSEGATGWIKDLKIEKDRLKALVEFTPWGLELIKEKGFRYFSPEFVSKYTDKENPKKEYKNVLLGGAITNRPFLTNLAAIVLSTDMEDYTISLCVPESPTSNYFLKSALLDVIKEVSFRNKISEKELIELVKELLNRFDNEESY